jgi:hypothetical protein
MRVRRWLKIGALVFVAVLVLAFVATFFIDEPLRRVVESNMNRQLVGYTTRVEKLHFHPIGFSLDLLDVVLVQDAHPDPPVMRIGQLHASVHWRELLFGRAVADFQLYRPVLYIDRTHLEAEAKDPTPVEKKGWQDALQAIYPLKINRFEITEGDVTYYDGGPTKPLHLGRVRVVAENIRNIHSPDRTYPSAVKLEAIVFDNGHLTLDGHADFLAEPHAGVKAAVKLDGVPLAHFQPVVRHYNLEVRRGTMAMEGDLEYAPTIKMAALKRVIVDGVDADYVHKAETAVKEQQTKTQVKETVKEADNKPGVLVKADEVVIRKSKVTYIDKSKSQEYKLFLSDTDVTVKNVSNHQEEGVATAVLNGKFMASGATHATLTLHPAKSGPEFDLLLRIENTDVTTLNDLLRAYGKFDVAEGTFTLYSEMHVKNRVVRGYVKPLFSDLHVYEKAQDEDKPLGKKIYEKVVSGVSKLLKNRPRREVATVVDISGPLGDAQTSTIQAILRLLQNAFVKAILPGFDREVASLRSGGKASSSAGGRSAESDDGGAAMVKPSRDPAAAVGDTSPRPRSRH